MNANRIGVPGSQWLVFIGHLCHIYSNRLSRSLAMLSCLKLYSCYLFVWWHTCLLCLSCDPSLLLTHDCFPMDLFIDSIIFSPIGWVQASNEMFEPIDPIDLDLTYHHYETDDMLQSISQFPKPPLYNEALNHPIMPYNEPPPPYTQREVPTDAEPEVCLHCPPLALSVEVLIPLFNF